MARVPAGELAAEIIGRVRLTLRRVKEEARVARLGPEPLAQQFEELPVAVSDASPPRSAPATSWRQRDRTRVMRAGPPLTT